MTALPVSKQLLETAGIRLVDSTTLYPDLHQDGDTGLPMLVVENPLGRAVIALYGAHLMAFQPAGQAEMLWVSPKTALEAGKPIRGGIPLCMPWFGPGPDGKSMHGFARTTEWTLVTAEVLDDEATRLELQLSGDASTNALWPHAFEFRMEVVVGRELKLEMTVVNPGSAPIPLAFAFHTYFAVPDVAKITVAGLEGTTYIDKMDNFARKTQDGAVTISSVTDRIYLDVGDRQTLHTGANSIKIDSDAKCAVVWNAWSNDVNIPDMGEGNHVGYVCVERCDVADRAVNVQPGGSYRMRMTLAY